MSPVITSVCVFCSASDRIDRRYLGLAEEVGHAIADRRWQLVSGGGSVSMMGALARAARSRGGRTIGVIPEGLLAREVADLGADELVVTRDMRQRKGIMDERSDAFLALPGGIGTLEELLEAWTARTLHMHAKPVVVLDPWGDYTGLRDLIGHLVGQGFLHGSSASELAWAGSLEEALELIEAQQPPAPLPAEVIRAEALEAD